MKRAFRICSFACQIGSLRKSGLKILARTCIVLSVLLYGGAFNLPSVKAEELPSANLTLESPDDYQVFQRQSRLRGTVIVRGHMGITGAKLQLRLSGGGRSPGKWKIFRSDPRTGLFRVEAPVPAGGWYRLEVRGRKGGKTVAQQTIEHVGVGEVFVLAGQSNSTNYGAEQQKTDTSMVASFDGTKWALADDPQPGVQDGSKGGSFVPAFGDALYEKYKVPIGVASVGCGATSVRQWLMRGEKIEVLPTLTSFVRTNAPGQWEATGALFEGMMKRIGQLGTHGFRAVLWHQGESDAGQARSGFPADRQITGAHYRQLLQKIIRSSQEQAGWEFPWFVAQATYHNPSDSSDAEFRQAQKWLWDSGIALEGPDSDALAGDNRDDNGQGVHFSAKGLQAHGKLWAQKVGVYLDRILNGKEE